MKKNKSRRFSNMVVLTPVCNIILMFCLVFFAFHFIIGQHIDALTQKNIELEFKIMDEIFQEEEDDVYATWGMEETSIMIPTEYMVLDAENEVLFASEYFFMRKGLDTAELLAQHMLEKGAPLYTKSRKIAVEDKTYLVSAKYYEGVYEDGFVVKADAGEASKQYLYVIYLDITALQVLMDTINRGLMVILICVGGLSMILISRILRRVRWSFRSLEQYLERIGKREKVQKIPEFSYDEFTHVVQTIDEMSERIAQSEQLQKQFFQNASHELRTPLMSIQGYAEGLKYHVLKDTESCCDIILEESKRMSDLVDEILFLSRFEAQELKKETIEVKNVMYACANQVYLAQYHQIELLWEIPEDITMIGDESLLQRAFSNILSNALRYAKSKIRVTAVAQTDETVEIHIIDDGDGILPEDLPHIFERFYKGKGGNFGIGLSMTKDIIQKHDGSITVNSKAGCTDFCIKIPVAS